METNDQAAPEARAATQADEAQAANGARARKRAAQLESQNDLAYITGEHDAKDTEKQVRTPNPRRQPAKAKEARGQGR